jgi:hypothetical protein
VILREEQGFMVLEKSVLTKTFVHKREGVIGDWRRLHNEELKNCKLYQILR